MKKDFHPFTVHFDDFAMPAFEEEPAGGGLDEHSEWWASS